MTLYEKYKETRNAAWQCMLDTKVNELPIKVTDITKYYGIRLAAYGNARSVLHRVWKEGRLNKDGFCAYHKGQFIIYYNDKNPSYRIRFTIAHELGHIIVGYIMKTEEYRKTHKKKIDHNLAEKEANMFASRLLMPSCVLHEIGALTPESIAKVCMVSLDSARVRAERMQLLEQRKAWYKMPLEVQVKRQFQDWIEEHKLK